MGRGVGQELVLTKAGERQIGLGVHALIVATN